jgi:hypothetical protein
MGRHPDDREEQEIASLIRAARALVGDDANTPLTEEEEKVIAELRSQLPRPSAVEIAEKAKRLARRNGR